MYVYVLANFEKVANETLSTFCKTAQAGTGFLASRRSRILHEIEKKGDEREWPSLAVLSFPQ